MELTMIIYNYMGITVGRPNYSISTWSQDPWCIVDAIMQLYQLPIAYIQCPIFIEKISTYTWMGIIDFQSDNFMSFPSVRKTLCCLIIITSKIWNFQSLPQEIHVVYNCIWLDLFNEAKTPITGMLIKLNDYLGKQNKDLYNRHADSNTVANLIRLPMPQNSEGTPKILLQVNGWKENGHLNNLKILLQVNGCKENRHLIVQFQGTIFKEK